MAFGVNSSMSEGLLVVVTLVLLASVAVDEDVVAVAVDDVLDSVLGKFRITSQTQSSRIPATPRISGYTYGITAATPIIIPLPCISSPPKDIHF